MTEYEETEKICDKVHNEFKNCRVKTEKVLEKICEKNNITLDGFYYVQAFGTFDDYMADYFVEDKLHDCFIWHIITLATMKNRLRDLKGGKHGKV